MGKLVWSGHITTAVYIRKMGLHQPIGLDCPVGPQGYTQLFQTESSGERPCFDICIETRLLVNWSLRFKIPYNICKFFFSGATRDQEQLIHQSDAL